MRVNFAAVNRKDRLPRGGCTVKKTWCKEIGKWTNRRRKRKLDMGHALGHGCLLYICHYHISYDGFHWTVVTDDPFVSLVQIG